MRVIAGSLRGRRLLAPEGLTSRPILDPLKQRLFDILGPACEGAVVADLFAGVGSLGIEALSRGALLAVFVERDRAVFGTLRENIERLGLGGRARLIHGDALALDPGSATPGSTLVFVDPPFPVVRARGEAVTALLGRVTDPEVLGEGGVIVLRTPPDAEPVLPDGLAADIREHGKNVLRLLRRRT